MDELTGLEIAVIGMAGRFPGADSIDAYWDLVRGGESALSALTDEQLAEAGVPEEVYARPDYVRSAGVLADAECFDAGFFGLSPRDAAVLDPQQRIFLECSWHALEHAGYARNRGEHCIGVYAGSSFSMYLLRHLLPNDAVMRDVTEAELLLANQPDTLATRTSYHLNLTGPAIAVQTACSTALVAVHLACQALLAADCDIALAGASSIRSPQTEGYQHVPGGIRSPEGTCLPFDARAQGTLPGAGAGLVVLKRLADALADGYSVHAVLKGTAINNDGASKVGFTAPSIEGQAAVIRSALAIAGVAPATIGYVETHGTGTPLGDPIEFAALTDAYGGQPTGHCAIGSAKSQLGHLDAAASIAGLLKAILSVKHGVVPPSPYFERPNPELDLDRSPFFVPTEAMPWHDLGGPRRAAVSAFGMGGTNAHAIIEQAPAVPAKPVRESTAEELLLLSARSPHALAAGAARLADFLATREVPLAAVADTLRMHRAEFPHRMAVVATDPAAAAARLRAEDGHFTGVAARRDVAFLFPGQGAQHVGMALGLYRDNAVFRRHLDECSGLLREQLGRDLIDLIGTEEVGQTRHAQPALFAVEYALAKVWENWGLRPAAMIGHSIGEYAAACLAGVMDLPDALGLVAVRGRLMQSMPAGGMLSVTCPAEDLAPRLTGGLGLAAVNAPRVCVVSGPRDEVDRLAAELAADGIGTTKLHTSHAFHSAMMDPILDEFAAHVAEVTLRPPTVECVSGVTGAPLTGEQATDPAYWASQLRQPVRFSQGLEAVSDDSRLLLEVGPGTTLATLARQHRLGSAVVFSSLRHPREATTDTAALAAAFGRAWVTGAAVGTFAEPGATITLPGYAFERQRHWFDVPAAVVRAVVRTEAEIPAVPGESGTERAIRDVWQRQLGIPRIGRHDNFFELGGHSVLATQIIVRLRETLDADIPAAALFDTPTIASLAATVDELLAADDLLGELDGWSAEELLAELDLVGEEGEQRR